MSSTLTEPVSADLAPAETAPWDWRASLRLAGRSWLGVLLVLVAIAGATVSIERAAAVLALVAGAGVLGTLATLAAETLRGSRVRVGIHVLAGALAVGVVVGLFTGEVSAALVLPAIAFVGGWLGVALTHGRPTWRRYLTATAVTLAISTLIGLAEL